MAPVIFFSLKPLIMCWLILSMWSWQFIFLRNPDWYGGRICISSAQLVSFWFTIFSSSLAKQLRSEIGLYELKSCFGLSFLWIIFRFAAFQLTGM